MIRKPTAADRIARQSATASTSEAMVWLTASMLLVCLAAVCGLLLFILACGLPAFWPRHIDLVASNDGQLELGQPVGVRDNAVSYRIGHADRSTSAIQNFISASITPSSIGQPQHAAMVERSRWDALYGIPLQVTQPVLLPNSQYQTLLSLHRLALQEPSGASEEASSNLSEEDREQLLELHDVLMDQAFRQQLAISTADAVFVRTAATEAWTYVDDVSLRHLDAIIDARWLWTSNEGITEQLGNLLEEQKKVDHRVRQLQESMRQHQAVSRRLLAQFAALPSNLQSPFDAATFSAELDKLAQLELDLPNREKILTLRQDLDLSRGSLNGPEAAWINRLNQHFGSQVDDQKAVVLAQLGGPQFLAGEKDLRSLFDRCHANAKARLQVRNELDYYRSKQAAASLSLAVTGNARPLAISAQTAERVFQGELTKELLLSPDGEAGLSAASGTIEVVSPNSCLILLQHPGSIEKQVVSIQATDFRNPEGPGGWLLREWQQREVPVAEITRFTKINQLSGLQRFAYYLVRWREFLWESPREANNAGGIFPAIWGTVVLTLIMIVAVVPFGVMAALYLHEYTSSGPLVSLIRISINNLAGVPSIIYGVFGVAFFCYTMGAFIDGGPANADIRPMPVNLWLLWLLAAFATGVAALSCTIRYAKRAPRRQVKPALPRWTLLLWLACFGMVLLLLFKNPLFEGFYHQQLPNPTFGKGGILWAALTLALLTLPIVIVSTEEALAAVPKELRDASAACGASKWQTIRRIVIPYATPGIMTGGILAMTRGVGQVAPLMLVGALPRAPELPLDTEFPFLHLSRSFMHLGYQVYAFGIQGQNTEATQPLVFTCILLLVGVVALLNMSANWMRSRMKQRIRTHQL